MRRRDADPAGRREREPALGAGLPMAAALVVALALALVGVGAGAARASGPVPVTDPAVRSGIDSYRAGDRQRALAVLEIAAPRRRVECAGRADELDVDDPRRLGPCHGAARAYLYLGLARGSAGDAAGAYDAFAEALSLRPAAFPDPDLTPPKLRDVFEAARRAAAGGATPGALPGVEHRPPLVAVGGRAIPLDAVVRAGEPPASLELIYAVGTLEAGTFRTRARPAGGGRWAMEVPAGATLGAAVVHYRLELVDPRGTVARSRWYPLHLVPTLAAIPERVRAELRSEVEGPALDALDALGARAETGPARPLPAGVERVDGRPRSPDEGGLLGLLRSWIR